MPDFAHLFVDQNADDSRDETLSSSSDLRGSVEFPQREPSGEEFFSSELLPCGWPEESCSSNFLQTSLQAPEREENVPFELTKKTLAGDIILPLWRYLEDVEISYEAQAFLDRSTDFGREPPESDLQKQEKATSIAVNAAHIGPHRHQKKPADATSEGEGLTPLLAIAIATATANADTNVNDAASANNTSPIEQMFSRGNSPADEPYSKIAHSNAGQLSRSLSSSVLTLPPFFSLATQEARTSREANTDLVKTSIYALLPQISGAFSLLKTTDASGQQQLRLQLYPEHLGTLEINLRFRGEEMFLHFTGGTEVISLLQQHTQHLLGEFAGQGFYLSHEQMSFGFSLNDKESRYFQQNEGGPLYGMTDNEEAETSLENDKNIPGHVNILVTTSPTQPTTVQGELARC